MQAASKGQPDTWEEALDYPGARDYARLRTFLTQFDFGALEPRQDLLVGDDPSVRAADLPTDGVRLVYTPRSDPVALVEGSLTDREAVWRHPATGEEVPADVEDHGDGPVVSVPFLDDGLLVAR